MQFLDVPSGIATLQAAREAISDDRNVSDLRDPAYDLERTPDLLYMDTKDALDYNIARKAEEDYGFVQGGVYQPTIVHRKVYLPLILRNG